MLKIVLDANTWVRFARNRNIIPLAARIAAYNLVPVANNYLLSEVFDALVAVNWMPEKLARQTLSIIALFCFATAENVVYRLSPDPKDNYLFDLAIQYNCPSIISDNTKLLASFPLKPIPVKSTSWFFKTYPL